MKTTKNIITRGFLVMVLSMMAMTAVDMMGNGAVFCKTAQAIAIKIPKNANANDTATARRLNQNNINATISYKWKNGRLIQLKVEDVNPDQLTAFTGLTDLDVKASSKAWKSVDFARYKNLKKLYIHDPFCYLQKLNISKNKKLTDLTILSMSNRIKEKSSLKKLDLTKNKNLKNLHLQNLPIKKLDLTKNTKLRKLELGELNVDFNLSKLKKLQKLYISENNRISTFSLQNMPSLKYVTIDYCDKMKKCVISNCKKLKRINIKGDQISQINIKNCPKLPMHSPYPTKNSDGSFTQAPTDPGINAEGKPKNDGSGYEYPVLTYDGKIYLWVDATTATDIGGWKLQN